MNPITCFALLFSSAAWLWPNASTQNSNNPKPETECPGHYDTSVKMDVYTNVGTQAEYPGGEAPWGRFVRRNFNGESIGDIQDCNVKVKLVITDQGEIRKVVALHGDTEVKEPNTLEKEIIRLYKKSGRWVPATCGARQVTSELVQSVYPCSKDE